MAKGKKKKPSNFDKVMDVLRKEVDKMKKENPEAFKRLVDKLQNEMGQISGEECEDDSDIVKITPGEWSTIHPQVLKCGSDKYYADFANELFDEFLELPIFGMPKDFERESAMALAAYLEDLKSEIGVWSTIRGIYKNIYGGWLPFYDCSHDDYFDDDLNIEDAKFLIWQALSRVGQTIDKVYSPYSTVIDKMAEIAYDKMIDRFDSAPAARRVTDFVRKTFKDKDYYQLRQLALWLVADCKLTGVPGVREEIMRQVVDFCEDKGNDVDIEKIYYFCETDFAWVPYISMMGMPAHKLLASLAAQYGCSASADLINGMEVRERGWYKILSTAGESLIVEDDFGEELKLTKKSLEVKISDIRGDMMLAQLVFYNGEWWQNGVAVISSKKDFDKDLSPKIGNYFVKETLINAACDAVKKNRGRRVYYCKNVDEIGEILGTPAPMSLSKSATPENLALLLSDEAMPIIITDGCDFFSDRNNPYYDPYDREYIGDESMNIIFCYQIPDDVAQYIVEKRLFPHASIYASQGKKVGKAIVQDNMRFLCGFYRVPVADRL